MGIGNFAIPIIKQTIKFQFIGEKNCNISLKATLKVGVVFSKLNTFGQICCSVCPQKMLKYIQEIFSKGENTNKTLTFLCYNRGIIFAESLASKSWRCRANRTSCGCNIDIRRENVSASYPFSLVL